MLNSGDLQGLERPTSGPYPLNSTTESAWSQDLKLHKGTQALYADRNSRAPIQLLQHIPREIRNQIWKIALTSPDGVLHNVFYNSRTMPSTPFSIALLCTCKQVYQECKDMAWKYNEVQTGYLDFRRSIPHQVALFNHIQHLRINIMTLSTRPFGSIEAVLTALQGMVPDSTLQSIVLVIPSLLVNYDFTRDTTFEKLKVLLESAGGEGGYLSHIQRKIMIQDGVEFVSSNKCDALVVEKKLKGLATAFGGGLWYKRNLCYKNQVQVAKPVPEIVGDISNSRA